MMRVCHFQEIHTKAAEPTEIQSHVILKFIHYFVG
jgi:hypothetical protein